MIFREYPELIEKDIDIIEENNSKSILLKLTDHIISDETRLYYINYKLYEIKGKLL